MFPITLELSSNSYKVGSKHSHLKTKKKKVEHVSCGNNNNPLVVIPKKVFIIQKEKKNTK